MYVFKQVLYIYPELPQLRYNRNILMDIASINKVNFTVELLVVKATL